MANWAVDYARADDTGAGTSWAAAKRTLKAATDLAAAGDTIYVDAATDQTVTAVTTFTIASGVRIISSNDKTNFPPQTLATLGVIKTTTHTNYMTFNGAGVLLSGFKITTGSGASSGSMTFAAVDGNRVTLRDCLLEIGTPNGSGFGIVFGLPSSGQVNAAVDLVDTDISFLTTTTVCPIIGCRLSIIGGQMPKSSGSIPANPLFRPQRNAGYCEMSGVDFSSATSALFADNVTSPCLAVLSQCKLGSGAVGSAISSAGSEYRVYDCSSADTHYHLAHYAYNGSTTVSTAIYADDGAGYDAAGDKCSWVVAGNANTSLANPYVSPWIARYNEATAAATPYLEVLRDGSTTAYTDTQVWSEWSAKTAGGSPLATLYSDFGGHLSSGTNQGSGAATWTGDTTPWIGKLECPSITPAEIGHISARVVVAGNHTLYVDPQIRGL